MDATCSANGRRKADRQTGILNYESKPQTFLKFSGIFMRQGEVTRPETLQAT